MVAGDPFSAHWFIRSISNVDGADRHEGWEAVDVEAWLRQASSLARDASHTARSLRLPTSQTLYNVHTYAWPCYAAFVRRYHASSDRPVAFVAMNPGKNGAVQTGIPFTDHARAIELLPEFEKLRRRPPHPLPKPGREQSGRRVYAWGLRRFGSYEAFLRDVVVLVTCPLAILEWRMGRAVNVPLPSLSRPNRDAVVALIHRHLPGLLATIRPRGVVLLGNWARDVWIGGDLPTVVGLHPAAHLPDREWLEAMDRTVEKVLGGLDA